jgi:hypothetical protein
MSAYSYAGGKFRLANRNFGAHNLLVNDAFDIIGVIDFDGIIAARIEVAAQYPTFAGLDQQPPGNIENRPFAIETHQKTEISREEYKEMVTMSEARLGVADATQAALSACMESDAVIVYHKIFNYAGHQKSVNDKWKDGYSYVNTSNLRLRARNISQLRCLFTTRATHGRRVSGHFYVQSQCWTGILGGLAARAIRRCRILPSPN